jgi:branched-chain amino acid transport system substrate-binding protein
VADQLPDSNPVKKSALAYKAAYEKAYGVGSVSTFGGHSWDAGQMLQRAIGEALKTAQPGTEAFRVALRNALENLKDLPLAHGVMNTTPADHNGLDNRARVMVQIVDGKWKVQND